MADDYRVPNNSYQPDNATRIGPNYGYQPDNATRIGPNYGYQPDNATQYAHAYPQYGADSMNECEPVHGWLKFFLIFFVGIGSIATLVMDFIDYDFDNPAFINAGAMIADLAYLATAAFTIVAFYKRQSDAVYLARIFIISCFVLNLGALLINSEGLSSKEVTAALKSIIWCGVWFVFTFASNQVKERIPEHMRQFKVRDLLLGASILLPLMAIVTYSQIIERQQQANALSDFEMLAATLETMDDNQATDGRILITLPDGVTCEKEINDDGLTVFSLENVDEGTYGNIVSEHESDMDKYMAEDIFEGWMPEDATSGNTTVLVDEEYTKDGNTVWAKKLKIRLDDVPVYWDFAVVADGRSDKFYVISTYSLMDDDPTWYKLFSGIKFL